MADLATFVESRLPLLIHVMQVWDAQGGNDRHGKATVQAKRERSMPSNRLSFTARATLLNEVLMFLRQRCEKQWLGTMAKICGTSLGKSSPN